LKNKLLAFDTGLLVALIIIRKNRSDSSISHKSLRIKAKAGTGKRFVNGTIPFGKLKTAAGFLSVIPSMCLKRFEISVPD